MFLFPVRTFLNESWHPRYFQLIFSTVQTEKERKEADGIHRSVSPVAFYLKVGRHHSDTIQMPPFHSFCQKLARTTAGTQVARFEKGKSENSAMCCRRVPASRIDVEQGAGSHIEQKEGSFLLPYCEEKRTQALSCRSDITLFERYEPQDSRVLADYCKSQH